MTSAEKTTGLTAKNLEHALTILKKFEVDSKTGQTQAPNDDKSNMRRYIILHQILNTREGEEILKEFVKREGWRMLSDWISRWWQECLDLNGRVGEILRQGDGQKTDLQIRKQLKLNRKPMPGLQYALLLVKCCG